MSYKIGNRDEKPEEWNDILEECKKESTIMSKNRRRLRQELNKQLYQKLREEIEDGTEIKRKITSKMSYHKCSFHYFINRKLLVTDEMHNAYDFVNNDFSMSTDTAIEIFQTTRYGNKILIDLFREKFPAPISISISRDLKYDAICIFVHWYVRENSGCVII